MCSGSQSVGDDEEDDEEDVDADEPGPRPVHNRCHKPLSESAPAAAASAWEMPDVEGMLLQEAWEEIVSTTDGAVVPETAAADGTPYEQINLTNWVVCEQSPSEGDEFSAQEPPELEVARLNGC